ncbi:MAG: hypothetical protein NZ954_08385 [Thermofilaceae archaeon]|nr:hypothetical protein [Thermofilaceae archaeon]MCX8179904.1 hypothetical protein [Thermofilaceae archaeon]MDW8004405.1 hypothetical protein [Thermofilaceae archaeon]
MSFLKKLQEKVTPPRVEVNLMFKKTVFQLGEELEGLLHVLPHEEVDCSEIRCELTCVESVRVRKKVYDSSLKREVENVVWESSTLLSDRPQLSGPTHLTPGVLQSFPFKFLLPPSLPPSFKSFDRRVEWKIKGVVAVPGRPDATSKVVELQVVQQKPVLEQRTVTCRYCGAVYPESLTACPNCGAPRTT